MPQTAEKSFMKSSLSWLAILVLLVFGCATPKKDLLPPPATLRPEALSLKESDKKVIDEALKQLTSEETARNMRWLALYKRAQLWQAEKPELACESWRELSKEELFPLKKLAELRSYRVCAIEDTAYDWKSFDPWLRSEALDIALVRAQALNKKSDLFALMIEKSKDSSITDEKLEWMKKALEIAEQDKNAKNKKIAMDRMIRLAPRLIENPKKSQYLEVAADLRKARAFDKSRELYTKVLNDKKSSLNERIQAYRGIRSAYKLQRKKEDYLKVSQELSQFMNRELLKNRKSREFVKTYYDIELEVARSLWTNGFGSQSKDMLNALVDKMQGLGSRTELFWILGRMEEEKKSFKEALEWYGRALEEPQQSKLLTERIMWYQAWILKKSGRLEEALKGLENVKSVTQDEFVKNRTSYWQAQILLDLKKKEEADAILTQLTVDDPLGYYGLLSYRLLDKPIAPRRPETLKQDNHINDVINIHSYEWLVAVEERELAEQLLNQSARAYRRQKNQTDTTWATLLKYYMQAQAYQGLYNQIANLSNERRMAILDENPELLFPRPYQDIVKQSANQFDISEELIYSIMRQESAFNPKARSPADAFGLMQVIPEVAQKSAGPAQVAYSQADDLYKPHVNIPIGSAFLRELWRKQRGQFVLIVASYNASEDAIQNWLLTRWRGDTVEFIEDIPYEETRTYVRLVMRNLIYYSLLNSGGRAIDFPEWVLKLSPPSA